MNKIFTLAILFSSFVAVNSCVAQCDGIRFATFAFPGEPVITSNIVYGNNVRFNGTAEPLEVDIYQPLNDTASLRPLVIVAHGGSFIGGSRTGTDVVPMCKDFAKLGYVAASIEYRIGMSNFPFPGPGQSDATEAVVRAVQDARAAVRYFRKNVVESGNTYKIDTSNIYMAGVSAGGFVALQLAYLDQASEIPSFVNMTNNGLAGGIEGESGNLGYSSKVKAIINIAGAIGDTSWIQAGDIPVLSLHGTADATVPFDTDIISLAGLFPIMTVHGSNSVHLRANNVGLTNCFEIQEGANHVPHVSGPAYYDTLMTLSRDFLLHFLCNEPLNCTSNPIQPINPSNVNNISEDLLSIFPNPASSSFTITNTGEFQNYTIQIFDALGKLIYTERMNKNLKTIETNSFTNGVYHIQFNNNEKVFSKKMVVTH
jgi:poly(3-hydroxybutyrate) depolymerase